MKHFLFLLTTILLASALLAQSQDEKRIIKATRIYVPLIIDGNLNDESWLKAEAVSNFTQREPKEGNTATEKTEVKILYDDDNFYVGVWCYDSNPGEIIANGLKRDFSYWLDDNFEIIIDTYLDKRNGYLFITNPNRARYDALVTDEGNGINENWNGIWDVRTSITNEGWFAEIIIPFSSLRFYEKDNQVWGVNFERNIRRKREQVLWKAWLRNYELEKLSQAGELNGIENIQRKNIVETKPYATFGIQRGFEPYNTDRTNIAKFGGDIKIPLTSTLTIDATINTDFSQVEADQQKINLSRFSLYFPEKREFFLEGAGVFDTQLGEMIIPFYSRKIGLNSNREEIPIYGGLRLVGKEYNSDIGFITMQTASKNDEPTTNYTIARLKQNVLDNSYVGFIMTNKQSSASFNRLYGIDGLWTDNKVFGNNVLQIGGAIAATNTSLTNNQNNIAFRFFENFPNDFIEQSISITSAQEDFNPEIGFLSRKNFTVISSIFKIRPRPSNIGMQNLEFKPFAIDYYIDNNGSLESLNYEARPLGFTTSSGESVELNFQRHADKLSDDFEIIHSVFIPKGTYWWNTYEIQFESNPSRSFSGNIYTNWGNYYNGTKKNLRLMSNIKINEHLSLGTNYATYWIELPQTSFHTQEISQRITYGFSTMLTSSLFAQWDNESNKINLNFRLHWIPSIGSDFYFVYNHLFDSSGAGLSSVLATAQLKYVYYLPVNFN